QLEPLPNEQILLFVKLEQLDDFAQVFDMFWVDLVPSLSLVKVLTTAPPPLDIHVPLADCIQSRNLRMDRDRTLGSHRVRNGDYILVGKEHKGGKPVIYLFSPLPVSNIRVQLSLVKVWRFSAIYPPAPINLPPDESLGGSITWTVDTRPDGSLFDRLTNREVSYLFWEAHTNPRPPVSPTTQFTELVAFDPARPTVHPSNSALLPFDKVTGYIDDALLAMELHTEARTSFITYWLPNLSKHTHIALRFLPQDQYEASAPFQITPAPEITTRVFMLFMGVRESDLGAWVPAQEWSRIVGVDRAKAKDASLFRVLEWGGMEIQ
ncbi:hypothetical protein FRC11_012296, partial [Ceratobasidium sp. 423]